MNVGQLTLEALYLGLWLSAPFLIVGLAVGAITSVLQNLTQIQEPAMSFVPKLVGVVIALVITGPSIGRELVHFTHEVWSQLAHVSL